MRFSGRANYNLDNLGATCSDGTVIPGVGSSGGYAFTGSYSASGFSSVYTRASPNGAWQDVRIRKFQMHGSQCCLLQ